VTTSFEQRLARLRHVSVAVGADNIPDEDGTAAVLVTSSDGTVLKANYWRLIQDGRAVLSSFDHQKEYGLPAPIDAKEQMSNRLEGRICNGVRFDTETADLTLIFGEATKLQVFNFTAYEIWEIRFPDGTGNILTTLLHELATKQSNH
jgi:hypothetical protein